MKRIFIQSLIAIVAIAMQARDFTYQDVTYTVIDEDERTCEVKAGSQNSPYTPGAISSDYHGEIILPPDPKDGNGQSYTLVSIGNYAFIGCSGLTSVTIPNSVISIGYNAFFGCSGLTSVTIPNSVTEIGYAAFRSCSGLTSVTIPNSVTELGHSAFMECSRLTSATIPNSVTDIYPYTFYGCSSLASVMIPNSVTSIGQNAFSYCSSLTSVTIPNSVISIGYGAFSNCPSLHSVTIPNSVTSIGNYVFSGCKGLTSVYYSATEPISGDLNIFSDYDRPTLYVPAEAVAKCKTIDPWKNFSKIEAYGFSGIEPIHSDFDWSKPHEFYNINGAMVGNATENLAPGIYIARQGNAVKKIAVK